RFRMTGGEIERIGFALQMTCALLQALEQRHAGFPVSFSGVCLPHPRAHRFPPVRARPRAGLLSPDPLLWSLADAVRAIAVSSAPSTLCAIGWHSKRIEELRLECYYRCAPL